jgi:hypothetical protein
MCCFPEVMNLQFDSILTTGSINSVNIYKTAPSTPEMNISSISPCDHCRLESSLPVTLTYNGQNIIMQHKDF